MTNTSLKNTRSARVEEPLELRLDGETMRVEPGEVRVCEEGGLTHLLRGDTRLCSVSSSQFNVWLRTHHVVYISWS